MKKPAVAKLLLGSVLVPSMLSGFTNVKAEGNGKGVRLEPVFLSNVALYLHNPNDKINLEEVNKEKGKTASEIVRFVDLSRIPLEDFFNLDNITGRLSKEKKIYPKVETIGLTTFQLNKILQYRDEDRASLKETLNNLGISNVRITKMDFSEFNPGNDGKHDAEIMSKFVNEFGDSINLKFNAIPVDIEYPKYSEALITAMLQKNQQINNLKVMYFNRRPDTNRVILRKFRQAQQYIINIAPSLSGTIFQSYYWNFRGNKNNAEFSELDERSDVVYFKSTEGGIHSTGFFKNPKFTLKELILRDNECLDLINEIKGVQGINWSQDRLPDELTICGAFDEKSLENIKAFLEQFEQLIPEHGPEVNGSPSNLLRNKFATRISIFYDKNSIAGIKARDCLMDCIEKLRAKDVFVDFVACMF